ncbi:MAG TPA: hypothetical protein VJX16_25395 [Terriglobales bacterium]|nr:hypothetical protein [Terriglobales bacterium]
MGLSRRRLLPRVLFANAILCLLILAATLGLGQAQDNSTTRSPHGRLEIPCQNCHTAVSWKPIRAIPEFDHNKTSYPLAGSHEGVACTRCHTKMVFSNTGTRCADCHADIHRRQMGANCESCHNVSGWTVTLKSVQNHENRFPLVGAHAALECDSCHKGAATGQFQGLSFQCYSCHAKDYQQTTSPNHVAAAFPATCEQCHTITTWAGARFDHLKITGYALTGMHAKLDCAACHVGGRYQGTQAACVACHMKDYQGTTNPNHVATGIPQQCDVCHSTAGWIPASFDHNNTPFPLTGAHAKVPCSSCHINNSFSNTPTDCYSCHKADYQGTTNPAHAAAGFPTTCQTCHSTTSWLGATFNHTFFPLNHGGANGVCATCHTNPSNYAIFQCTNCHLKPQTDSRHQGVGGYVYNSVNCYNCHRNGRGG